MKRLPIFLLALLIPAAVLAQTQTYVQIRAEAAFTGTCVTGAVGISKDTQHIFVCEATAWVDKGGLDGSISGTGAATNRLVLWSGSTALKGSADLVYDSSSGQLLATGIAVSGGGSVSSPELRATTTLRTPVISGEGAACTYEGQIGYKELTAPEETEGYICSESLWRRLLRDDGGKIVLPDGITFNPDSDGDGTGIINLDMNGDGTVDFTISAAGLYSGSAALATAATTAKGIKAADATGAGVDADGNGTNEGSITLNGYGIGSCAGANCGFSADEKLILAGGNGIKLDPTGGGGENLFTIDTSGNVGLKSVKVGDSPPLRQGWFDTNHDGVQDTTWFQDKNNDGRWNPGELLLANKWEYVEDFYDCNEAPYYNTHTASSQGPGRLIWGSTSVNAALVSTAIVLGETDPTLNGAGVSGFGGTVLAWSDTDGTATTGDDYGMYSYAAPITTTSAQQLALNKMRYFRARVGSYNGRQDASFLVGGVRTSSAKSMTTMTSGIYFYCAGVIDTDADGTSERDLDGDGTANDSDGDSNWWAITAQGQTWCEQLADGDADGYLDCDGDATGANTAVEAINFTATNTGVNCVLSSGTYSWWELAMAYDGAKVDFYIDNGTGDTLVASHTQDIPVAPYLGYGWVAWAELRKTNGSTDFYVDYTYYLGRR